MLWNKAIGAGGQGGGVPSSISFVTSGGTNNNFTTYTFNSVSFGTADPNRVIAISVITQATIASATIGGVAATVVGSGANWIIYAPLPSGTSGTITITHTAGTTRCWYRVYSIIAGDGTAPYSSIADSTASTTSSSLALRSGGVALVQATRIGNSGAFTLSWGGADSLTVVGGNYGSSNFYWVTGNLGPTSSGYSSQFSASASVSFVAVTW